jgi:Spy/CpxP family protein refolding chaperone
MNIKPIFTLAVVLIFCAAAFSQASSGKTDKELQRETVFVEGHLNKMKADIQLTAEQEGEIRKLLKKLYHDREKISKQEAKGNKEKIGEKRAVHEVYSRQLNDILTSEQQLQLSQKAEERRDAGLQAIHNLSDSIQTVSNPE